MKELLTRLSSGIIYVCIFIFSILYSEHTYITLITIFGLIALYEFQKLIKLKTILIYPIFLVSIYLHKYLFSSKLILLSNVLVIIASAKLLFNLYNKKISYPTKTISKIDLCIRYIIIPFTLLILLPFLNETYEPNVIIYITILIWTNDSFAYLSGKSFGKTKLFETVSPKKTIEGFIGGLLSTIIVGVIISRYSEILNIKDWVIIPCIVSILGTYGDLIESKFKRVANVKDSGKIMPGHGGILDRLDSLFFISPFLYLYMHYLT